MFKANKAHSIKDYLEMLPQDRRETFEKLQQLIENTAPSLNPNFLYNMPGYGSFTYKNYKKQLVEWPTIAIANQKNYMSIYICAIEDGEYVVEKFKNELGKVSVGKSCIRFKKLEDLNLETLVKAIKHAEKYPGLMSK
jgi:uncharacterized protein YdhG (YjbR/CyaY superfamily)